MAKAGSHPASLLGGEWADLGANRCLDEGETQAQVVVDVAVAVVGEEHNQQRVPGEVVRDSCQSSEVDRASCLDGQIRDEERDRRVHCEE